MYRDSRIIASISFTVLTPGGMLKLIMSKVLAELLGVAEPLLSDQIRRLESASANPSVDVRLIAEMIGKVHVRKRALGLDPDDTTSSELFYSLKELCRLHDSFLRQRIGVKPDDSNEVVTIAVAHFFAKLRVPSTAWVLKHSVAKKMLKKYPPKKVMKQLNYRSVDSLLKRESVANIYAGIRIFESADWQQNFVARYKKLTPADFEVRPVEVIIMDRAVWGESVEEYVALTQQNITHLKEIGVIALLPLPGYMKDGVVLTLLLFLLHYQSEIRAYSSYCKLQQVHADFGERFANMIIHDATQSVHMAGQPLQWRVVHRYFGAEANQHPEIFEPHVQPEDVFWRKAETVLYKVEPAMHFWNDMDYVGVVADRQIISFNLLDMAVNLVNNAPYGQHTWQFMQQSLWNELYARYLGQDSLRNSVLHQMENSNAQMLD